MGWVQSIEEQLRVYSTLATISYGAAFITSKLMPIDILTDDIENIYNVKFIFIEGERGRDLQIKVNGGGTT